MASKILYPLITAVILVVLFYLFQNSTFSKTPSYFNVSHYIFCITGTGLSSQQTNTYFAPILSNGLGAWTPTTNYPLFNGPESNNCSNYNGYVYCVEGNSQIDSTANSSYYASVSSNGLGVWKPTTLYPLNNIPAPYSCTAYNGYIYCLTWANLDAPYNTSVDGKSYIPLGNTTVTAYYAPLSNFGIGNWIATTNFPVNAVISRCQAFNDSLYCYGGSYYLGLNTSPNASVSYYVYYSNMSSNGLSNWVKTNSLPFIKDTCAKSEGYSYCLFYNTSTNVVRTYYEKLSFDTQETPIRTTDFPTPIMLSVSCTII